MSFGAHIKQLRAQRRITLREFCVRSGQDPSNWSKVERGMLLPPKDEETLLQVAQALEIPHGAEEWFALIDLAAADRGAVPQDLMDDEELAQRLPMFFRTLRGLKPTEDDLEKMVELLRSRGA